MNKQRLHPYNWRDKVNFHPFVTTLQSNSSRNDDYDDEIIIAYVAIWNQWKEHEKEESIFFTILRPSQNGIFIVNLVVVLSSSGTLHTKSVAERD